MEMQFGKKYRVVEIGEEDAHHDASYNLVGEVVTPLLEDFHLPEREENSNFWGGWFLIVTPESNLCGQEACFHQVILEEYVESE